MATTRQDAWTEDEDLLLAEVVLRHIREGGTQLSAFKEVGRNLSRTAAACGFRWNSYVRKLHKANIEEAKQHRKEIGQKMEYVPKQLTRQEEQSSIQQGGSRESVLEHAIEILQSVRRGEYGQQQFQHLQEENERLRQEKDELTDRLMKLEEEYVAFFEYVDKKRNVMSYDVGVRTSRNKGALEKVEK
ncbi:RsfA family transcriptional regulator [Priestia taiwanensis]|uniref:DNA-binding protein n=1 Tax=Priestia taiwanensis TaxID=1347902 RepID=A0A917EQG7_9BACI|nr:RsfA family transcriptional regulator [Priestia taiwanensis]MBM7362946.1 prespore-specific regulator [Priestia taiwanensis]GGE66356.1 DNA-binding protein [Priestia taiwanensis]